MKLNEYLIKAIQDYAELASRGYPLKKTLDLVSDRYHLGSNEKAVLYRGVLPQKKSEKRSLRILKQFPGSGGIMSVDTLNQVYSIVSYLEGRLVFIATDGMMRDASEIHGGAVNQEKLKKAIGLLVSFIEGLSGASPEFYIDEQVNNAAFFKAQLESMLKNSNMTCEIFVSQNVDANLIDKGKGVLATSDTAIIDRSTNKIYDLARAVLNEKFSAEIPDIRLLLN